MNKKVSTIFAMAALMGGGFSGSAYAFELPLETLEKEASAVVLLQDGKTLAFTKEKADSPLVTKISDPSAVVEDEALNYTWDVLKAQKSAVQPKDYYFFRNAVTKDTIAFISSKSATAEMLAGTLYKKPYKGTDGKMKYAKDQDFYFTFGEKGEPYVNNKDKKGDVLYLYQDEENEQPNEKKALTLAVGDTPSLVSLTGAEGEVAPAPFILAKLTTMPAHVSELNDLYNGYGFNLAAQPQLANVDVQNNLFAAGRVWAYEVKAEDYPDGYTLTNADNNGTDLYIPVGVYFFTNPVFVSGFNQVTPIDKLTPDKINWLSSTLIALSSTQTQEGTDSDRANGAGFILVEAQGSSFIYERNASDAEGNDLMIHNACFTINDNFASNDNYPYEVVVKDFYYQKSAGYAGTDDQSHATAKLSVTSYENSYQHLVSYTGDESRHIFRLQSSSVIQGRTLLKTTKEAAIYNIQFVSGNSDLNNKYLTVGAVNGDFQWEAKGAAIADTDYLSFQYVITAVDGANVTFTNRETGISFTTQLFTEEGTNRYSMSISRNSLLAANATQTMNVKAYTVRTAGVNTYTVDPVDGVEPITANLVIQLIPVEDVDAFAGFVTEETGTIRTLAFARDKHDTSNMLYAGVNNEDKSLDVEYLTNDISSAAQWQLDRVAKKEISRVYVYFNESTQSIDNVPEGDKVSAYTYRLQYINDGEETDYYLASPNTYSLVSSTGLHYGVDGAGAEQFIIKENVDGSVSLIQWTSGNSVFASLQVAPANASKAVELYFNENNKLQPYSYETIDKVYASESAAREIKTYLADQPADISWPAHEGHVTIMSDRGNYITMDENRDGIVVNENDADTYYLYVTDKDAIVPSFYITKGVAAENGERMFLFNPTDSVAYYVADGAYDRVYQWSKDYTKVMFKAASINETRDTLTMTVKGETKYVAEKANDDNRDIWGGLKRFKWQIIEAADADGYYYIRQTKADDNAAFGENGAELDGNDSGISAGERYLSSWNERLTWSDRDGAMLFQIENAAAPTANEGVSATEVKIIATDGAVNVKNAAGKNVVISTILGQIVANEVLTSDNATISVPAGIAIVSVDGEEAVKVSVR